jgi:hypothetical protein
MTGKDKKTTDELAAARCGMAVDQWRHVKAQTSAARARGKRPAGNAGAETKLAGWGEVNGQEALFTNDTSQGGER